MSTDLLTPSEIASLTKLSVVTIRRMLDRGEIVGHKLAGRWRVKPEDYEAWIASTRYEPPEPEARGRAMQARPVRRPLNFDRRLAELRGDEEP